MEYKAQYKWSPRDEQAEEVYNLVLSAKNALASVVAHEEVLSDAGVQHLEDVYSGLSSFLDSFQQMVEI